MAAVYEATTHYSTSPCTGRLDSILLPTIFVCPTTLRVYLVGDDDSVLTLFVVEGCLSSRIAKIASASVHREHYVLRFDTPDPLRVNFSAFSLLNERSSNVAQTTTNCTWSSAPVPLGWR